MTDKKKINQWIPKLEKRPIIKQERKQTILKHRFS